MNTSSAVEKAACARIRSAFPVFTKKTIFGTECYLKSISNPKLRIALSKLRTSSHDLEIERGRYVRPKLNVDERLCLSCNVVENEEHFVTAWKDNEVERALFTNQLEKKTPIICQFSK